MAKPEATAGSICVLKQHGESRGRTYMRKGASRQEWTVLEERFLVEQAGKLTTAEIAFALGRTDRAIERKAAALRRRGHPVYLRVFRSNLQICTSCGRMSATIDRKRGICGACRAELQLAEIQARTANLLAKLPVEERAKYAISEARTGSSADSFPPALATYLPSCYAKDRIEELNAIRVENTLIRNIQRRVKAAQKRKERIQKKVKMKGCLRS